MRLFALTTVDVVLWGSATAVAALMMAGMMNRRRAHLTETLRKYVQRQRDGGDGQRGADDEDASLGQ